MEALMILAILFSLVSIGLLIAIIVIVNKGSSAAMKNIDSMDSSESFHYDPSPPPMLPSPQQQQQQSEYYSLIH
jgi:hypothetical protein